MGRADNCGSSASINFPLVYLLRINILGTAREQNGYVSPYNEKLRQKQLFLLLCSSGFKNQYDEKHLLEQNKWVQRVNNAPEDFPSFVQEGIEVKVVASENFVKRDSGLIYRDFEV
ncbi:hypothetical protein RJ640_000913, partial [Escallonia rubra]